MTQPELATTRLLLRPFVLADGPTVQRLAGAYEVANTTLNIPHPYPDDAAAAWIATHPAHFAEMASVTYAITLAGSGELLGAISLVLNRQHQHAEMGYWLGLPYWNNGYTSEAAAALVGYGFTALDLHRIFARHYTRNPASGRVMQKIGMRFEGVLREHTFTRGQFEDTAYYGILRQEWQPR